MPETNDMSPDERRQRVLYATMLPAVRLARVFRVPLAQLLGLLEMAYFHELRRRDLKMRDVAALLDVSTRKAALLATRLKENFATPEHELERRIEFMLWAEPLSLAKIEQVLTDVPAAEVEAAVAELVEAGRIVLDSSGRTPVYALAIHESRRVWDTWLARIDGLNNALGSVCDAVYGRFFAGEARAFARTLQFRVRPEDHHVLQEFYENELFPLIQRLDSACAPGDDATAMKLSIFWAPDDLVDDHHNEET